MKKILFFPFLQFDSGHHHVADSLIQTMSKEDEIECKKIELLSYTNPMIEKIVSSFYLNWIHHAPATYEFAYQKIGYADKQKQKKRKRLKWFLENSIEEIIANEQPDLIVATHSFPSFLLNDLKLRGKITAPIANVYTDFFISDVWGIDGVDLHLVPNRQAKNKLMLRGVRKDMISVTGIPIDERIKQTATPLLGEKKKTVLVAGGNSGLGQIADLVKMASRSDGEITYKVLCGNNEALYQSIKELNSDLIQPLPYINSKVQMNMLYEQADAIIVKPGGVTISEALEKRLPIFIHANLPGQERVNLKFLESERLVFPLNLNKSLPQQLGEVLNSLGVRQALNKRINDYLKLMENPSEKLMDALYVEVDNKMLKQTV